jgi:hypothetical protein
MVGSSDMRKYFAVVSERSSQAGVVRRSKEEEGQEAVVVLSQVGLPGIAVLLDER